MVVAAKKKLFTVDEYHETARVGIFIHWTCVLAAYTLVMSSPCDSLTSP